MEVTFCAAAANPGTFTTATANQWLNGNFIAQSTQTNLIATLNAAFSIADVQLEVGSIATEYEAIPYHEQIQACQRYYEVGVHFTGGFTTTAGVQAVSPCSFKVTKRRNPGLVVDNALQSSNISGSAPDTSTTSGFRTVTTSAGTGPFYASGFFAADAEFL